MMIISHRIRTLRGGEFREHISGYSKNFVRESIRHLRDTGGLARERHHTGNLRSALAAVLGLDRKHCHDCGTGIPCFPRGYTGGSGYAVDRKDRIFAIRALASESGRT